MLRSLSLAYFLRPQLVKFGSMSLLCRFSTESKASENKSTSDFPNSSKIAENLLNFSAQDESILTPKKVVEYLDRFVIGQA